MDDNQLISILGQGGLGAGLLWLLWSIGKRIVASLDKVADKLDQHTKVDLEHHAKVSSELAELSGRIEGIAWERERTPVETPIPAGIRDRKSQPVAGGAYSIPRRAPRDDDR